MFLSEIQVLGLPSKIFVTPVYPHTHTHIHSNSEYDRAYPLKGITYGSNLTTNCVHYHLSVMVHTEGNFFWRKSKGLSLFLITLYYPYNRYSFYVCDRDQDVKVTKPT